MDAERSRRVAFVPRGTPFAVERTEGCYLITPDGTRILDAAGGAIVANIGHGRSEVAQAAATSLAEISYVVPPFATDARVRLVERLVDHWLPEGLTRVGFTSGGSESVDAAIRLARQHHVAAGRPKRWKIIGREMSYHGVTIGALSVGGHASRRKGFEPLLLDLPKAPAHYCLECSLGRTTTDCREAAADKLEELIVQEGPETVAAFIAEPVVGSAGGALVPPDGYWPRVAEICRTHGVLLLDDEVMTGFVLHVTGLGSLRNLHFTERPPTHAAQAFAGDAELLRLFHLKLLVSGVLSAPRGMFAFSTVTTEAEIDGVVEKVGEALRSLRPVPASHD